MTDPTSDEFVAHSRFVHALARRLLFDEHEAADVAQDALVIAMEDQDAPRRSLRAWLRGVVRNRVGVSLRSRERRAARERRRAKSEGVPATVDDLARLEAQRRLVEAVRKLDREHRTVIVMRFFEDLPPRRIAKRLGVSVETVKSRQQRGLAKLRGALDRVFRGRGAWCAALVGLLASSRASAAPAVAFGGARLVMGLLAAVTVLTIVLVPHTADERPRMRIDRGAALLSKAVAGDAERNVGPMRGVVVDDRDQPLEGAQVRALDGAAVRTGPSGDFEANAGPSRYVLLRVSHPECFTAERWVDTQAAGDVRMVLNRGTPLAVVVTTVDGEPVAGAIVTGWFSATGEDEDDESFAPRTTDAEGRARLGAVRGSVTVFAHQLGFVSASKTVPAAPADVRLELDPGGVVEGRVTDPDGNPVAGARVHVQGRRVTVVHSDANGRYRLPAIPPWEAYIRAEADGFAPGYFGPGLGWGGPIALNLPSGDVETGIDIVLSSPTTITGRVTDERGQPVAGVRASVVLREDRWVDTVAYSNKEGRFRLGPFALQNASEIFVLLQSDTHFFSQPGPGVRVEPGQELDVGTRKGAGRCTVKGRVLGPDGNPVRAGRVDSTGGKSSAILPDGSFEIRGLRVGAAWLVAFDRDGNRSPSVEVEAGSEASGTTVLEVRECKSITGRVVMPAGEPVRGRYVMIVSSDAKQPYRDYAGEAFGPNEVRRDGTFTFRSLLPGLYKVGVSRTDLALQFDPAFEPWTVEAGGRDVTLVVPFAGGYVKGRVRSKRTGLPLTSYVVALYRMSKLVRVEENVEDIESESGTFLTAVPPGKWVIEIAAESHAPFLSEPLRVTAGKTVDLGGIRLGDEGRVSAKVTDPLGNAVRWAAVYALPPGRETGFPGTLTNQRGHSTVWLLRPGRYAVCVLSPRHPFAVHSVDVEGGVTNEVAVQLAAPAPLTIRVVDDRSRPLANAELTWTCPALAPMDSSTMPWREPEGHGCSRTGGDGILRKPFLPLGPVQLSIAAEGFRTKTRTVTLEPGQPRAIEVRLERAR